MEPTTVYEGDHQHVQSLEPSSIALSAESTFQASLASMAECVVNRKATEICRAEYNKLSWLTLNNRFQTAHTSPPLNSALVAPIRLLKPCQPMQPAIQFHVILPNRAAVIVIFFLAPFSCPPFQASHLCLVCSTKPRVKILSI